MWKISEKFLLGVVVSFFLFPIQFRFLPGLNTKMMLAVLGVAIFAFKSIRDSGPRVHYDIVVSFLISVVFSFMCYMSASIHGTGDDSYSTYYTSFLVWIFAAYAVCSLLRCEYGKVSVRTIVIYLAAVCVFQCLAAQMIHKYPGVQEFVDRYIEQGQIFLHEIDRIYGIGAALDSGGVRFAFTLLLMSYFIADYHNGSKADFIFLACSFVIITVFGSMIARTTIIGAIAGVGYILWKAFLHAGPNVRKSTMGAVTLAAVLLIGAVFYFKHMYAGGGDMRRQLRFAFETFFNWAETGRFGSASFDKLNNTMWRWPTDPHTWMWGTGRFGLWTFNTDIGYCRFILYCGIFGFSVFVFFFIHNTLAVCRKYEGFTLTSFLLLCLVFVIWVKVSTDIFQVYALLLCADSMVRDPVTAKPSE